MTTLITGNFNYDQVSFKEMHCDNIYLSANKKIYGDTSLTIDCPIINIGASG